MPLVAAGSILFDRAARRRPRLPTRDFPDEQALDRSPHGSGKSTIGVGGYDTTVSEMIVTE